MPVSIIGNSGIQFPDSSLQAAAASPYVLKNRIINGAMMIDQRNAGASVTTTNNVAYTIDRYRVVALGTSLGFSSQRSSTSTNGFVNSYLATVTSAKTVASTDQTRIDQFIEGFNVADLGFGTASAQTVTLSFWVRSSVTGTYCVTIANGSSPDRCYIAEYTISSANTFEYKTITISGDTTGTWAKDNTAGMGVSFILGMGSSFNGAVGWQSGEKYQTSNQTQWIGTSGATFYITGVQLEQNTSATPFERRLYNQELANCQRYCIVYGGNSLYNRVAMGSADSTTQCKVTSVLPVPMRTIPSMTVSAVGDWQLVLLGLVGVAATVITLSSDESSPLQVALNCTITSNANFGSHKCCVLGSNGTLNAKLTYSAEL